MGVETCAKRVLFVRGLVVEEYLEFLITLYPTRCEGLFFHGGNCVLQVILNHAVILTSYFLASYYRISFAHSILPQARC